MTDLRLFDERVADSMSFLEKCFDDAEAYSFSPYLTRAIAALRRVTMGGKHLRARLVHIGAGDVSGEQRTAATIFAGAVDVLHAAFLIHDDIIDDDPLRRGLPTIHHEIAQETGSPAVGNAMGILAGDLGLIVTFQALCSSHIDDALARRACTLLAGFAAQTVSGEMLDVAHLQDDDVEIDRVRLSNHLKTSLYSFTAPLHLGAVAAGRDDPATLAALRAVADPLGVAYQAADDIAGAVGTSEATGKVAGGDLDAGRKTLLTMRLEDMTLPEAVKEVIAEGDRFLAEARRGLSAPELSPLTVAGLSDIIDRVEEIVHAYA
ncbi:polyprenyl synthetase family protein [Corynebacterium uterequi]|uniref:Geranylgeranyl pyrophosphate synthase n=1 Tax=Corynebacterium uterequi TaxID=1072256 RepID=A0A0G3H9P4_9CORY|nr:polyprenyl synthetase family protein [Corynebacterium uterequi]AKK10049.1 geranylgeranyl pyrophosphate synthase [Corynebacterium uterequi]